MGSKGSLIELYEAYNEQDEVNFAVKKIKKLHDQGVQLSDIAVLYRSNAQSRVFEDILLQSKIPFRIYGGQRFF